MRYKRSVGKPAGRIDGTILEIFPDGKLGRIFGKSFSVIFHQILKRSSGRLPQYFNCMKRSS